MLGTDKVHVFLLLLIANLGLYVKNIPSCYMTCEAMQREEDSQAMEGKRDNFYIAER